MKDFPITGLTAEERQFLLIKESKEYMRGNKSLRQFQEAERKYGTDYGSVTLELASKDKLLPKLWRFLASNWWQD
ncbi:MAG: hypothetical protein RMY30_013810 [Nostoc sp. CmiSLP01]|nr:hypothetical protein [Nostoc sp. CmiSLP01]MDZ8283850.1 hypothetical protein [Nostoc sp. ChiSLP01]